MNIKSLKAERESLWAELDAIVAAPLRDTAKEKEVRAKIKDIQQELYKREMTPVMQKLEHDLSEGLIEEEGKKSAAVEKLAVLKAELG